MEQLVKRKRGRPRKNPIVDSTPAAVKRPRGRPPKIVRDVIAAISDVVKVVEVHIVKKRGRPPKAKQQATAAAIIKKDYNVTSITDLEFWAAATDRDMFKQAVTDYNKIKKSKATPEARWYADRIEVVAV